MIKALLTALALTLPATVIAAPVAYALEAAKSQVGFVFKLNNADAKGSMPIKSSNITIDTAALQRSSVDVTVDVRRARTGFIFATEALKGASVLNARKFGTIRFVSTRIRLNGAGNLADGAKIDGNLTIRGVTRPVTLNAALFRQRGTEAGDLSKLSFRLNGTVSRSAFGATGYGDLVDDTIRLDIVARVKS
ncbi:YceI family protein [uncultured Litoreibacter sp.]|uniref:YceI family protein n=1 Tax=uncultured Litoreibacter sp. TaxID=1392394 RepID=UPI002621D8A8|nr:YceI family protein [uncultured Litoreibacter sp.]